MRRLVVAAALVDDLAHPTRLLAARRSAPAALAGAWELPGGKVEPGEQPLAALRRELAEELGVVVVAVGDELVGPDAGAWPLGDGLTLRVWPASIEAGEPRPLLDHDLLRWLGPGEWLGVGWLPGDLPVVRALLDRAAASTP